MKPLRTVIVDDEPLAVRGLELTLGEIEGVEVVGTAADGRSGLALIRKARPDLVLLDIRMPLADGLQVARALDEADAPAVIFVTAFGQFALEAFELAALDYVLKPVAPDRLRAAVERARKRVEQSGADQRRADLQQAFEALERRISTEETHPAIEPSIWISDARGRFRLPLSGVAWLEAQRDYVRIHTVRGESYIERGTLGELTDTLDSPLFQRVHRSATVNLNQVNALRRRRWGMVSVTLASGVEIPVGRSYVAPLKARLEDAGVMGFRKQPR